METTLSNVSAREAKNQQTTASLIHLSTLSKYFFPFANYITPLLIWTFNKDKEFVDEHGRQAINFQLSILVYTLLIGLICLPFILIFATDFISLLEIIDSSKEQFSMSTLQNISGYLLLFSIVFILLITLFIFELYAVINASIHATRGEHYKYPLCIPFIKTKPIQNI